MNWQTDIKTNFTSNGDIEQFTILKENGIVKSYEGKIFKTQEEQFKKALIAMGWTPPQNESHLKIENDLDAEIGRLVRSKMQSSNGVPVSLCTITKEELDKL